jgi:hypothetical protein
MHDDAPLFEIVTAAADAAARRLTTAANVRAMIGSPDSDDALIEKIADRATALIVAYCGLARDAAGTPPTFGLESCKATWSPSHGRENSRHSLDGPPPLVLPWRPAVSITAITEAGVALENGDFRLLPGGLLQRMRDGYRAAWCFDEIIVEFDAGYELPDDVPDDLEGAVIEQIKFMYSGRKRDAGLLSEMVPDVYQASYGDSRSWVGDSGLLVAVAGALTPYRNWIAA